MFLGILVILAAVAADQFSKFWIDTQLVIDNPIVFNDYFNLIKVWNTGVSFSMFSDYGDKGVIILSSIAVLFSLLLLYWMYQEKDKWSRVCLGLIIGGAIGNVIDRVRFGAVLDFLDFHYKAHHWPAFNLADTFVCIGAFYLIMCEVLVFLKNRR